MGLPVFVTSADDFCHPFSSLLFSIARHNKFFLYRSRFIAVFLTHFSEQYLL